MKPVSQINIKCSTTAKDILKLTSLPLEIIEKASFERVVDIYELNFYEGLALKLIWGLTYFDLNTFLKAQYYAKVACNKHVARQFIAELAELEIKD